MEVIKMREKKPQITRSMLNAYRGEVMGIGRVKFPKTSWFKHEVPLLSFIVIKKEDGTFVSTCIHLRIDGYGKTVDDAKIDMADNIWSFLDMNFNNERSKDRCWLNIYDLFKGDKTSTLLWDKYHAVQLMLAERDIATDKYSQLAQLQDKINELQNKVNELEKKIKKMNEINTQIFRENILPKTIVGYEPAEAA